MSDVETLFYQGSLLAAAERQKNAKIGENQKGTGRGREGDGKKNVTTICDKRHNNLRHGAKRSERESEKSAKGGKDPHTQDLSLSKKQPVLLRANFVLTKDRNGLTTDIFVVEFTGRGLVVKRLGVLSKVQMLNLVLGVRVFSLLPKKKCENEQKSAKAVENNRK